MHSSPLPPQLKKAVLREGGLIVAIMTVPLFVMLLIQGNSVLAGLTLLCSVAMGWNSWRLFHNNQDDPENLGEAAIILLLFALVLFSLQFNPYFATFWTHGLILTAFLLLNIRSAVAFAIFAVITVSTVVAYIIDIEVAARAFGSLLLTASISYIFSSRIENRNSVLNARMLELEKALAAKSEFLANMSHEMRTPLTTVLGYSESMLDDNNLATANRDQLEAIVVNARHLATLIDDVLDLSKCEEGQLKVTPQTFELAPMIAKLVRSQEEIARRKGLEFALTTRLPLPRHLHVDPMRLNQICFNLIGNAIKFTDDGVVELAIEYHPKTRDLVFRVIDTGIGVPIESQAQLFQKFYQADSTLSRNFGGSGLGLHISQALAQLMNGRIEYFPQDRGSIFQLSLRLEADPNEWIECERTFFPDHLCEGQQQEQFSGHVLVAEDSSVNQLLICLLVEKFGLRTTAVSNGLEAVDLLKKQNFDLILMDLQMPVMSGIEAVSEIRAFNQEVPVIALSADVIRHQNDSEEMEGFTDQLAKPIDMNRLSATFARYLSIA
jgi:signal transduction histidine kinase/CheY-like chemotaxis protein